MLRLTASLPVYGHCSDQGSQGWSHRGHPAAEAVLCPSGGGAGRLPAHHPPVLCLGQEQAGQITGHDHLPLLPPAQRHQCSGARPPAATAPPHPTSPGQSPSLHPTSRQFVTRQVSRHPSHPPCLLCTFRTSFFLLGGSNSLATIDVRSGYVGVTEFQPVLGDGYISHSWGAHIANAATIPFLSGGFLEAILKI